MIPSALKSGRRARSVLFTSLVATGLTLAACSGSGPTGTNGGGELNYALPSAVASLDPNVGALSGHGNLIVQGQRQSTLLEYKLTPESCSTTLSDANIQPGWMVSNWSASPDRKTFNFTLKPGIKSQHGNELTAADVEYSIKRMLEIDPTGTYIFGTLGGFSTNNPITIVDPLNFRLNVDNPSEATAAVLSFFWLQIHDSVDLKARATTDDPWAKKYLTANISDFGPWALGSFVPNQSTTYVRNPHYTGPTGNIKKVTFTTIIDSSQRMQLVASGQAQIALDLQPQDLKALESNPAVALARCMSANRDYLGLNAKDPILSKRLVRQAISLAIDRAALHKAVYLGTFGTPATSGISTSYKPTTGQEFYKFDVAKAKSLLAQAGHPNGFPMTITVSTGTPGPYANSLAIFLQSQLAKIGVKVAIATAASPTAFSAAAAKHQYQSYLWTETPNVSNPGLGAKITSSCGSSQNYGDYCDPKLDALAKKVLETAPGDDNYAADVAALSTMLGNDLPAIYLQDVPYSVAMAKCASSIPQSAQVKWAPVAAAKITC